MAPLCVYAEMQWFQDVCAAPGSCFRLLKVEVTKVGQLRTRKKHALLTWTFFFLRIAANLSLAFRRVSLATVEAGSKATFFVTAIWPTLSELASTSCWSELLVAADIGSELLSAPRTGSVSARALGLGRRHHMTKQDVSAMHAGSASCKKKQIQAGLPSGS